MSQMPNLPSTNFPAAPPPQRSAAFVAAGVAVLAADFLLLLSFGIGMFGYYGAGTGGMWVMFLVLFAVGATLLAIGVYRVARNHDYLAAREAFRAYTEWYNSVMATATAQAAQAQPRTSPAVFEPPATTRTDEPTAPTTPLPTSAGAQPTAPTQPLSAAHSGEEPPTLVP